MAGSRGRARSEGQSQSAQSSVASSIDRQEGAYLGSAHEILGLGPLGDLGQGVVVVDAAVGRAVLLPGSPWRRKGRVHRRDGMPYLGISDGVSWGRCVAGLSRCKACGRVAVSLGGNGIASWKVGQKLELRNADFLRDPLHSASIARTTIRPEHALLVLVLVSWAVVQRPTQRAAVACDHRGLQSCTASSIRQHPTSLHLHTSPFLVGLGLQLVHSSVVWHGGIIGKPGGHWTAP